MLDNSEHQASSSPSGNAGHLPMPLPTIPLSELLNRQDAFFRTGATRSYKFRVLQLKKLKGLIQEHEKSILEALGKDLRKHKTEAYLAEVGFIYAEISDALRHLKRWMKPRRVSSPLVLWPARCRIVPEPLGRALIIAPWNYPFNLSIAPLVGAIAAGNVAVLKPSEMAPHTAIVLAKLINENFDADFIHALNGGVELSKELLNQRWDHIFFTGSTAIGKVVAAAAAKHLTPCTLELGGKSPCIVSKHARIDVTVRRIVFGKFLNAGQTCIAPDYILVEESVHDTFISKLKEEIRLRFGTDALNNSQLPKVINEHHFERLVRMIEPSKVSLGGRTDAMQLLIEPTLITGVQMSDPVMKEEIFGPLLPIIPFRDLKEAKSIVQGFEKPLALYFFSEDKAEQKDIMTSLSFGGGCINETLMHLANPNLPFGGTGASGSGAYHGQHSFNTFSHMKSVLVNSTSFDPALRYMPWSKFKERMMRLLLK